MEGVMKHFTRKQVIWGLGLSGSQAENIRALAGRAYSLELWPTGKLPDASKTDATATPCMVCFTMASCRQFMSLPAKRTGFLELTPKVLLLDPDDGMDIIDEALEFGISDIIRKPLTAKRFASCLRKAAEAAALQLDIQRMAHEIFTERELLEKKNEALSFLVNFLSRISESLDETELLGKTFTCLQGLFPVLTMHAAIFTKNDTGDCSADLFVASPMDSPAHAAWRARLLEIGGAIHPGRQITPTTVFLPLGDNANATATPHDGHILTLPVHVTENAQFYLMLLTSMERNLSRDQAVALDSALRHMAISIKNVRRYQEVCHFADRDSLTGAYNRRHFEHALVAEIARHERYGEELSLLLLDIDHFKAVNDTWGHLKGDEVLRAIVATTTSTIRQTDYCVRYGGEEFVVLLPHTSSRDAAWLADRLRKKIEKLSFTAGREKFSITASIGVASLPPGTSKAGVALTDEADQALYQAKHDGRNRVVVFSATEAAAMPM